MKYEHGSDNPGDRNLGKEWEVRFIAHAEAFGIKGEQIPQHRGNPDVILEYPDGSVEAHEVKHKKPMWCEVGGTHGAWGLEDYRADLFRRFGERHDCPVFYTIHDWSPYGSRWSPIDEMWAWTSRSFEGLFKSPFQYRADWRSYKGGDFGDEKVPATVWHRFAFHPLEMAFERGSSSVDVEWVG